MSSFSPYATWRNWLVFALPSLLGIYLFMWPIAHGEGLSIPVAVMAATLRDVIASHMPAVLGFFIVGSAVLSLLVTMLMPNQAWPQLVLKLFRTTPAWLAIRCIGALFYAAVWSGYGPAMVVSSNTGALVAHDLLPVLLSVFIFAGLLLPILLNFGLLEFVGTLMTVIMRPVFRLPGRSAVDCLASWLGDGSVGILLTSKQYEAGYYTAREAAVIGTTFSAVSITFCLVVLGQVKLEHMFGPFYATICLAGLVAAIILPYLPPLRSKPDTYVTGGDQMQHEGGDFPQKNLLLRSLAHGLHRASLAPGVKATLKEGSHNALDMLFGVLPVIMMVGTSALMLAEYTPIFQWLGAPFVPLLNLLQIPEAEIAARSVMIGFADMFVPSILITEVPEPMTRFVIAALSVTQLIYMSEVGALLLGSKIPVSLWDLLVLFILRTLITLPVIALMAHWIF